MKTIVNRRNSLTGVLYRDDPTIMAWDLANEPYVLGDASGEILRVRFVTMPHPRVSSLPCPTCCIQQYYIIVPSQTCAPAMSSVMGR